MTCELCSRPDLEGFTSAEVLELLNGDPVRAHEVRHARLTRETSHDDQRAGKAVIERARRSHGAPVDGTMYELVYADQECADWIASRWPAARFYDARDMVHNERFEVEIAGVTADEFYPVMIAEGYALTCLGLGIALRLPERQDDCERWISAAKEMIASAQ